MKTKTKENVKIFLLALAFIYGFSAFWTGWHNLDSAQNFDMLNTKYSWMNLTDMSLGGKLMNFDYMYVIGARQMMIGFYIVLFSSFFLGRKLKS